MNRPKLSLSFALIFLVLIFFSTRTVQADSGLVGLINNYRTGNNLRSLSEDQNLTNSACWMAGDMAANGYPLNHTDSLGRDPFIRMAAFGVSGGSRAENIASLTKQPNSPDKIFQLWKNSPGHNANMLGASFTRIGVGYAYRADNKTYYWVADFASGSTNSLATGCSPTKPTSRPAKTSAPTKKVAPPAPTTAAPQVLSKTTALATPPASQSATKYTWKPYDPKNFENLLLGKVNKSTSSLPNPVFLLSAFALNFALLVPAFLFLIHPKLGKKIFGRKKSSRN